MWAAPAADERRTPALFAWNSEQGVIGWRLGIVTYSNQLVTADGKRVVCARYNRQGNDTVTVYDGPAGEQVGEWVCERPKATRGINMFWPHTLSGDGQFMIVGGESPVRILDAQTGKEHARIATEATNDSRQNDPGPTLAVSADGSKLAVLHVNTSDKKIEVYDVTAGKLQATHTFKDDLPHLMKFSPDGKTLAMWRGPAPLPAPVLVWEFGAADAVPKLLSAEAWAGSTCAAFSPDGKTLAVGYADGTTLLWDLTAK